MARNGRHPLLVLCIALFGVLLVPAGASAATCNSRGVVDAAYSNSQIATNTTSCYERALAELPADVDGYAPWVRANIITAMRRDAEISVRSNTSNRNARFLASGIPDAPVAVAVHGPVTNLLADLGPDHVDQVPTPVFAMGGAAIVLLLAGLVTSLSRVRTRRAAPPR